MFSAQMFLNTFPINSFPFLPLFEFLLVYFMLYLPSIMFLFLLHKGNVIVILNHNITQKVAHSNYNGTRPLNYPWKIILNFTSGFDPYRFIVHQEQVEKYNMFHDRKMKISFSMLLRYRCIWT